jgi:hypothetical protein
MCAGTLTGEDCWAEATVVAMPIVTRTAESRSAKRFR